MSRRPGSTCEPNLTPLLDIVLQLLMFFILITRFVSVSQNPEPPPDDDPRHNEIVLPVADSASPLDRGASDYIFLLINREGTFFFPLDANVSERTYDDVTGKQGWLYELWRDRRTAGRDMPTVILKPHRDLPVYKLAGVLAKCRELEMYDIRFRVEKRL